MLKSSLQFFRDHWWLTLHRLIHAALFIAFFDGLAFVEGLFPFGNGQFYFDAALFE